MLYAFFPHSSIVGAVDPEHFAEAVPEVVEVHACVLGATVPNVHPKSAFLVVGVLALVVVSVGGSDPLALAMSQSVLELPLVLVLIRPFVLAVAFRLAIHILALIGVSVRKVLLTLPMLETILKLAFVRVPVTPLVHSVAIRLAKLPLALVKITVVALPHTHSVFEAIDPIALITLPIDPEVDSIPLGLAIYIQSVVLVP